MTTDWNLLGDVFYRKAELCPMQWWKTIDLSKYDAAAAPYGGPIALVKKVKQSIRFTIDIFSSSGKEIGAFQWNSGRLLKMGWSNREELLCLQDDGNVLIYNVFGKFMGSIGMGKDANEVKVVDGQIFVTSSGSTGIAVLTSTQRFYVVNNIYDPKLKQLADLPDCDAMPSSWCVINNGLTPQILVAKEADLYVIDITGISSKHRVLNANQVYHYTEMAVSFDNKYLALFTSLGILWIGSSDLKDTYCEYHTGILSKPSQLVWCGRSAVIAKWDNHLLLIGPTKIHTRYDFDSPFHLVAEKDGVRIICERAMEFLQKVPRELEDVIKIGSVTPGAMLLEASRLYQERKKQSHEYLKIIGDQLPQAYLSCLRAAGYEFNPENQKALFRAAYFGKLFLTGHNPDEYVDISRKLRILNNLRTPSVGIPLTIVQLNHLTIEVLINRLLMRKLYWMAFETCKFLKVPRAQGVDKVLSQWACDEIQDSKLSDDQLAKKISDKFSEEKGVSYTEAINKAIEFNKFGLALNLINFEPSATKQIPLLLKLGLEPEALTKAIESGDDILISMVLMHWKDKLHQREFLRTISFFPVAHAFYLQQCKEQSREMLLDVLYQSDNHFGEALCKAAISYEGDQKIDHRVGRLVETKEAFEKGKKETFAKLTEEQVKLMKYQIKFEEELDRPFVDMSLNKMLHDLVLHDNQRHVEQLRKEFKVTDKRFWLIKIRALAGSGNWSELEKFSRSKKSPVGYEPFFDACVKHNNASEAKNYLSRLPVERVVRCHLKLGQVDEAAELAMQSKNEDDIELVLSKCSPTHRAVIEKLHAFKSTHFKH